eukprot:1162061-Pelagomonas_calceolata.AAC.1
MSLPVLPGTIPSPLVFPFHEVTCTACGYLPMHKLQVEIVSRTALRRWLPEDDEVLDPDAVNEAEHILQVLTALHTDHHLGLQWRRCSHLLVSHSAPYCPDVCCSQIGQAHFPDDPQMVLALANFLISIKGIHQTGASLLQHVSKLDDVSLADQFIVFVRMEVSSLSFSWQCEDARLCASMR